MAEEQISTDSIEEYYQYIIEQLEFAEMITSTFEIKKNMLTNKTSSRCKQLAIKILNNVAHI